MKRCVLLLIFALSGNGFSDPACRRELVDATQLPPARSRALTCRMRKHPLPVFPAYGLSQNGRLLPVGAPLRIPMPGTTALLTLYPAGTPYTVGDREVIDFALGPVRGSNPWDLPRRGFNQTGFFYRMSFTSLFTLVKDVVRRDVRAAGVVWTPEKPGGPLVPSIVESVDDDFVTCAGGRKLSLETVFRWHAGLDAETLRLASLVVRRGGYGKILALERATWDYDLFERALPWGGTFFLLERLPTTKDDELGEAVLAAIGAALKDEISVLVTRTSEYSGLIGFPGDDPLADALERTRGVKLSRPAYMLLATDATVDTVEHELKHVRDEKAGFVATVTRDLEALRRRGLFDALERDAILEFVLEQRGYTRSWEVLADAPANLVPLIRSSSSEADAYTRAYQRELATLEMRDFAKPVKKILTRPRSTLLREALRRHCLADGPFGLDSLLRD